MQKMFSFDEVYSKPSSRKVRIWLILLAVVPSCLGLYALLTDDSPIDNFSYYQQLANTIIAGVLGLLLAITLFYLGKMHDYHKDFIKNFSKIKYFNQICVDLLKNLSLTMELSEETARKSSDRKMQPIRNHLTAMTKDVEKLAKNLDDHNELFTDLNKSGIQLDRFRKNNFKSFIVYAVYFATISFLLNIVPNPTYGLLLWFLAVLVSGILFLLVLWYSNEQTMGVFHSYYEMLLDIHVWLNHDIFRLKYYTSKVQDIGEKISEYMKDE